MSHKFFVVYDVKDGSNNFRPQEKRKLKV